LNEKGTTILITTPYMDEAQRCHFVGFIYEGRMLSFKAPQSLIQEMNEEILELVTEHKQARKLLRNIPDLKNIYPYGETLHLVFEPEKEGEARTRDFLDRQKIQVRSLKRISPSFEDAFLALVEEQRANG
jgi:ABC-2 type transport system ATP-binding protein